MCHIRSQSSAVGCLRIAKDLFEWFDCEFGNDPATPHALGWCLSYLLILWPSLCIFVMSCASVCVDPGAWFAKRGHAFEWDDFAFGGCLEDGCQRSALHMELASTTDIFECSRDFPAPRIANRSVPQMSGGWLKTCSSPRSLWFHKVFYQRTLRSSCFCNYNKTRCIWLKQEDKQLHKATIYLSGSYCVILLVRIAFVSW